MHRHQGQTPLDRIIREKIYQEGPISLSDYMSLCLGHPQFGYYISRDPLGVGGDFTTAPEISQIFGELIGAWLINAWQQMGAPSNFILLEFGPGRATLMADILRVAEKVPDFLEAMQLCLMETSSVLQKIQKNTLQKYASDINIKWIKTFKELSNEGPILCVGNEFLDALPVDQYTLTEAGWAKKYIKINKNGSFCFCDCYKKDHEKNVKNGHTKSLFDYMLGDVIEISDELNNFLNDLTIRLQKQGGAGLFIDYGTLHSEPGDTVQAIHDHQYSSIFASPGLNDITWHIRFGEIKNYALSKNLTVFGPVSQGSFLKALGIELRGSNLKQNASEAHRVAINKAINRLVAPDQMGNLFKVIAMTSHGTIDLEGFSS